VQTAFGYLSGSSGKNKEPVNTIFTLSNGCYKNNDLVIPLQPRKVLISAT